ncbi:MAG: FAD-dependent monooxygenase [Rhodobacteraceae bacterium]|nr:FAD-dependent monooxygenase [Paracoccaceae bacterium]
MVTGLTYLDGPVLDRAASPLAGLGATVLGAGIGGLAVALALARRGARVTVLEQAEALREVGAGIQLSPNAMRVLDALGVAERLATCSPAAEAVQMCDYRHGAPVLRLDLSGMAARGGWHLVHRADLITVLADAAKKAGAQVRFGIRVSRVRTGPSGVRLDFEDGGHATAPLVVGADGVRGISRAALGPAPEPGFTGQVAWRALVPLDAPAAPRVQLFMGPGRHLVAYPLRDRRVMNLVAVQERADWAPEGWHHADDADNLRAAFADFGGPVPDLLAGVRDVHLWGLFRHEVAEAWTGGRLVLLGDAVHPTLPFLAQGACMAIEDAWVLTERLAAQENIANALAQYQALRRDRCRRIVAAANRNARVYHLATPGLRQAVHAGLRLGDRIAPGAALRRFDWLYGHDVTRKTDAA